MEAIDRLLQGRTSFLITHRKTATRDCDVLTRGSRMVVWCHGGSPEAQGPGADSDAAKASGGGQGTPECLTRAMSSSPSTPTDRAPGLHGVAGSPGSDPAGADPDRHPQGDLEDGGLPARRLRPRWGRRHRHATVRPKRRWSSGRSIATSFPSRGGPASGSTASWTRRTARPGCSSTTRARTCSISPLRRSRPGRGLARSPARRPRRPCVR